MTGNRPAPGIARGLRLPGARIRLELMPADSSFLRPGNGGNTAWVTPTSNAITHATASGGIAWA